MMTREDILRELELLPVWQLRTPIIEPITTVDFGQVTVEKIAEDKTVESSSFTHIASEDGQWLFVLNSQPLSEQEAQLLCNIFKAMHIKTKPAEIHANTATMISTMQPACIVAMGGVVAQAMLESNEPLEILRGTLHTSRGLKLASTYDVKHLLQHLPDKAKAWHDLCLAMRALQ